MKLLHSKLAAVAVASFALVCASACNGDKEPVQDVTFLTFGPAGAQSLALGYSASRGVHFAHIDASSTLHMARSQVGDTGGGGASFFSGSISGSSSFSGSTGGSASFSGATGGSAAFSGDIGSASSFSGTAIRNGAGCDLTVLCDIAAGFCEAAPDDCEGFSEGACIAAINTSEYQASITEIFGEDEDLAAVFCVFVNFIACIFDSADSLDAVSDAAAQQCADAAGLTGLFTTVDQSGL